MTENEKEPEEKPEPFYWADPRMGPYFSPDGDPLGPSRGCAIAILIGAVFWIVVLLVLYWTGVIG